MESVLYVKLFFLIGIIFSFNAFAEGHLIRHWMPANQQMAVEFGMSYDDLTYSPKSDDPTISNTFFRLKGKVYFGLLDDFALSLTIPYSVFNSNLENTSYSTSGFSDFVFASHGLLKFDGFLFYYGLNYNLSVEKAKYKYNHQYAIWEWINQYSGMNYWTPYLVFSLDRDPHWLGLGFYYRFENKWQAIDVNEVNYKGIIGAMTNFDFFYEHHLKKDLKLGGRYLMSSTVKTKDYPSRSRTQLMLYGEYGLSEDQMVNARLDYRLSSEEDGKNDKIYRNMALAVDWRMIF